MPTRSTSLAIAFASLLLAACGGNTTPNDAGIDTTDTTDATDTRDGADASVDHVDTGTDADVPTPDVVFDVIPIDTVCVDDGTACTGMNCGTATNNCGATVTCGSCALPETCGGGGMTNVCGCTDDGTACTGMNCGTATNNCGATVTCGSCAPPETCGGGGMTNVCGCTDDGTACTGMNCGTVTNNCGAPVTCGSCAPPETCGGGGMTNVCGCTPLTCADAGSDCGTTDIGCGMTMDCGACGLPQTCGGGGTPNRCAVPSTCVNLCLRQVSCPGGGSTTITGTVYAPNGVDPLPGAFVYVPNALVTAMSPGVTCDRCATTLSGSPLVMTRSGIDGRFSLSNMPVGTNIPLVIQIGRWRRQVTIPSVATCGTTPVPATLTRLPQVRSEGDIPRIAIVTGSLESVECVFRKIGVRDVEFSSPTGTGAIHLYRGEGSAGASPPGGTVGESILTSTSSMMNRYDMVLFACQGNEFPHSAMQLTNLQNYVNAGGRVLASHFNYTWLYTNGALATTAIWRVQQATPPDQFATVATTTDGSAMSQWLQNVGATPAFGMMPLQQLRHDLDAVIPPAATWLTASVPSPIVVDFSFDTPVGAPPETQCGRVEFLDYHVENSSGMGLTFPTECTTGPMSPQEKLLEYRLFDLDACLGP